MSKITHFLFEEEKQTTELVKYMKKNNIRKIKLKDGVEIELFLERK